jgi:eukaryotic-like serine/threonine-protein kinase
VSSSGEIDYPSFMREAVQPEARERRLGRYLLHGKIASGGMATVHFGRLVGEGGFSRIVAIKRMASHLAEDAEFRAMFLDEARLASRIRHPNVVSTIDVGSSDEGLFLVMDYVTGESLASLLKAGASRGARMPVPVAVRVLMDTLYGLHAAHVATDEAGRPLHIVHRDVSPQNILVGADGLTRVLDFGIAKAAGSNHTTRDGQLKGKFRYMAPEQVSDRAVTPRTDVYAASVVLWEALTGEHLFGASNDAAIVARVLEGVIAPPSKLVHALPPELDRIVLKGTARDPDQRFATALDMAEALEACGSAASARQVGVWVEDVAGDVLRKRKEQIARMDEGGDADPALPARPTGDATHTHTFDTEVTLEPTPTKEATISAVSSAHVPRSRSGVLWVAIALVSVTLASGLGLLRMRGSREDRTAEPGAPAGSASLPVSTTPTPASATPLPPTDVPPPPPSSSSVAAPPAAQGRFSSGSTPTSSPASSPPATAGHPPAPSRASAPPRPNCSPPYHEDSSGIRRVKPECL